MSLPRTLDQLATIADIRGDRSEADLFTCAASAVRAHGVESDADLEPLLDRSDLDPGVARRLRHMYDTGGWVLLESALADLPADLRWLFESGAVTIGALAALHEALHPTSAADLAAAVDQQAIRAVRGLGAETEYAIAAALFDLRASVPRVPLGRALAIAEPLLHFLRAHPGVAWAETAGSLRRGQETVGDLELVAASDAPADLIERLAAWPETARVLLRSRSRVYLLFDRVQVGIRVAPLAAAGAALVTATGSPRHVASLRALARGRGWQLDSNGLRADDRLIAGPDESSVYEALELQPIPPELREGDEEIDAARAQALPRLVEPDDIRGDLHMHSSWSDGRNTIEEMVVTCRYLGYEYIAITDHSPSSVASRALDADAAHAQADEIAALREKYPDIAILHGCEVDILPEGRLDFPDSQLERFDIVLASLHDAAGDGPEQLLRRYLTATQHPLVALITHPTNRLVPHRTGYDLNYDRLFEEAAATGTLIEVDGAPGHLDLDGARARRAVAAGALLAIDSDCHRAALLGRQMRMGVMTARRGWVTAQQVLNTQPLSAVLAHVARKRER